MKGIYYILNQNKRVIINNVYFLNGVDVTNLPRTEKMDILTNELEKKFRFNVSYQIYSVLVNSINSDNINKLYKLSQEDQSIEGWLFYPQFHGKKIYYYKILENDFIEEIVNVTKQLTMTKTSTTDIYLLHTLTDKSVGIAYVKGLTDSKEYSYWFKQEKATKLLIEAKFNNDVKKWQPIRVLKKLNVIKTKTKKQKPINTDKFKNIIKNSDNSDNSDESDNSDDESSDDE